MAVKAKLTWVQRPRGQIKMERRASAFELDSVSWKQILIIDLNHYWIY
jgi:hypothetical protein